MSEWIRVEGVRQLVRDARRGTDKELPKRLGQANRDIGERLIQRLRPLPREVGGGRGASVRPSASKDRVVLRTGGAHRSAKKEQWGRRFVPRSTPRPFILGAALENRDWIESQYLDGVVRAFKNVGFDMEG